jgi:hypothetical protein
VRHGTGNAPVAMDPVQRPSHVQSRQRNRRTGTNRLNSRSMEWRRIRNRSPPQFGHSQASSCITVALPFRCTRAGRVAIARLCMNIVVLRLDCWTAPPSLAVAVGLECGSDRSRMQTLTGQNLDASSRRFFRQTAGAIGGAGVAPGCEPLRFRQMDPPSGGRIAGGFRLESKLALPQRHSFRPAAQGY